MEAVAPFDGRPCVGMHVFWELVVTAVVVVVDMVVTEAVVVGVVGVMQSQGWPAQGHASAGSKLHTKSHLSSLVP